ncbi:hypothetical protein BDZ89DRAFT_505782 [Hymenopellis radicata]|nr:hypothetical protein BDZ89DRAFT_505782 [Hymenopellis radicata]
MPALPCRSGGERSLQSEGRSDSTSVSIIHLDLQADGNHHVLQVRAVLSVWPVVIRIHQYRHLHLLSSPLNCLLLLISETHIRRGAEISPCILEVTISLTANYGLGRLRTLKTAGSARRDFVCNFASVSAYGP